MVKEFKWTVRRERAALLVAEDKELDREIAAHCGIAQSTLDRWKAQPEFRARVDKHLAVFRRAALRYGIARVEKRMAALDDRWQRLMQLINARAAALAGKAVGAETGMLKELTSKTCTLDVSLLRELREHEKQAAREMEQFGAMPAQTEDRERAAETLREKLESLAARLATNGDAGGQ